MLDVTARRGEAPPEGRIQQAQWGLQSNPWCSGNRENFTGKFAALQAAPSVLAQWSLSEEEGKGLPLPSLKGGGWAACDKQDGPQGRSKLSPVSPQSSWLPPGLGLLPSPAYHLFFLFHSCQDSGLPSLPRNIATSLNKGRSSSTQY